MSNRKYVLYVEERGIYLGNFWGLGFWTKWDSVGQDCAVVFDSAHDAFEHAAGWEKGVVSGLRVVAVDCAGERYATVEECVAAGLFRWSIDDLACLFD